MYLSVLTNKLIILNLNSSVYLSVKEREPRGGVRSPHEFGAPGDLAGVCTEKAKQRANLH